MSYWDDVRAAARRLRGGEYLEDDVDLVLGALGPNVPGGLDDDDDVDDDDEED
jgi:hypothetical protein